MISGTDALLLDAASITSQDREEVQAMLVKLDEHVRKYMAFGGPTPYDVPYKMMSKTAAQILCIVTKRLKWNVSTTLMSEAPRFQGAAPTPHHWTIQLVPMIDVYDALLADFEVDPKLLLM